MISFKDFQTRVHEPKAQRMAGDTIYRLGRLVSVRISYALVALLPRVRANHVSVTTIVIVLSAIAANALYGSVHPLMLVFVQLLAVQLAALGDRVDGEVARYYNHFTQAGVYYDRVFHFLYPFALYLPFGYFFTIVSSNSMILAGAGLLAALSALASMADNLRHSIKYKIELEGHHTHIRDLRTVTPVHERPPFVTRLVRYLVFMMYDWVWALYLLLLMCVLYWPAGAVYTYVAHMLVSLIVLLYHVLYIYPRYRLFSANDFTAHDIH